MHYLEAFRRAFWGAVIVAVAILCLTGCSSAEAEQAPVEPKLTERFDTEIANWPGLVSARVITDTWTGREYLFYKVADSAGLTPLLPAEEEPTADVPDTNTYVDRVELELLACAIYQEAGGDACCDACRFRVGDVILNRKNDERFPDTIEEVLTQEGQYGKYHETGVIWPERAANPVEAHAVERAYETARELLEGKHSEVYGEGYIWQARFPQGNDYFKCCGTYFGK